MDFQVQVAPPAFLAATLAAQADFCTVPRSRRNFNRQCPWRLYLSAAGANGAKLSAADAAPAATRTKT